MVTGENNQADAISDHVCLVLGVTDRAACSWGPLLTGERSGPGLMGAGLPAAAATTATATAATAAAKAPSRTAPVLSRSGLVHRQVAAV